MDFVWIIVFAVCILYLVLIVFFTIGWMLKKDFVSGKIENSVFVSVIVAFRNEEKPLPFLLESLKKQTYQNFEILFSNDHSTDQSVQIISDVQGLNIKLIHLNHEEKGKKAALKSALKQATGELIVTTDADCIADKNWLKSIVGYYQKNDPAFLICPVKHNTKSTLLQHFFALDFLSLQASGAGSAVMSMPFMCNGANLAFKKTLWEKASSSLNESFASGDDVFLLHEAIKLEPKNKIQFLFSEESIIETLAPGTFGDFFKQRIRWASKAKGYKNRMSLITAIVVFLMNFSLFLLLTFSFLSLEVFSCFIATLIFKMVIDFPLLAIASSFYQENKRMLLYIPLQLIYFLYTPIIAIYSLSGKYEWKERKLN